MNPKAWFKGGVKKGATHMFIVCDTYNGEYYPVYVMPKENVREKYKKYYRNANLQKVMEVYSLKRNMESQLNEHRAFHFD